MVIAGCAQPPPSGDGAFDTLSAEMDRYVAENRAAGVVTMVVKDGQIVHEHATGFRDRESSDPMEVDDLFRIASQTKALTSVATMILAEENRLSIDDPVSDYIPEFAEIRVASKTSEEATTYTTEPARTSVTIRHLLTHTAGISYGFGPAVDEYREAGILGWYLNDQTIPIKDVAARLATLPFSRHPGEDWVYGYSTDILGAVVEIASGIPLDEFFQTRILDPLGMRDTHFHVPASKADRLVTVYGYSEEGLVRSPDGGVMQSQGQYLVTDDGPHLCLSGGAGLVSTAPDYIRLQKMLLNRGELDGVRILSSKSIDAMTTNQVGDLYDDGKRGFGLGFRIYNERSEGPEPPGAYSWGGAYHSHYWIDPSNRMVAIILTQLIPATGSDIHTRFRELVYEEIVQ